MREKNLLTHIFYSNYPCFIGLAFKILLLLPPALGLKKEGGTNEGCEDTTIQMVYPSRMLAHGGIGSPHQLPVMTPTLTSNLLDN